MATLIPLNAAKCVVVKIGSSLLVDENSGRVNQSWLHTLVEDIVDFRKNDVQILIISSGAIALGRGQLELHGKSLTLAQKQACAAVGQSILIKAYETAFAPYRQSIAQALLTLNDTENRRRWINAKATLTTLLELGVIPVINENDTVATDEIRYGDNDRLAARVAQMLAADCLVLLSDVDGLYDKNPAQHENARHLPSIEALSPDIFAMAGKANPVRGVGSGGMITKLLAAKIATEAGCAVVTTRGSVSNPLSGLANGTAKASWFTANQTPLNARKQWISGSLKPVGSLTIDAGAQKAVKKGGSLLPAGVMSCHGTFQKGDAVTIISGDGLEVGRGLIRYNAEEVQKIKGLNSADISAALGYNGGAVLIHRDDMVFKE